MVRLLCILGESEAGVSRTWCVRSGLDVSYGVTRAGGHNDQERQQSCTDSAL